MSPKRTSCESVGSGSEGGNCSNFGGSPKKIVRQLTTQDNLRDVGVIILQLMMLNRNTEEVEQYSRQQQVQILEQL